MPRTPCTHQHPRNLLSKTQTQACACTSPQIIQTHACLSFIYHDLSNKFGQMNLIHVDNLFQSALKLDVIFSDLFNVSHVWASFVFEARTFSYRMFSFQNPWNYMMSILDSMEWWRSIWCACMHVACEMEKENLSDRRDISLNCLINIMCIRVFMFCVCVTRREWEPKGERVREKLQRRSSVYTTPISTPYYNNNKNQKKSSPLNF